MFTLINRTTILICIVAMVGCECFATNTFNKVAPGTAQYVTSSTVIAKPLRIFQSNNGIVDEITFSPDSKLIASGGVSDNVVVWDVRSGQQKFVLKGVHSNNIFSRVRNLIFSPDSKRLFTTAHWESTVKQWDMKTGVNIYTLTHEDICLGSLAHSTRCGIYATTGNKTVLSNANDPAEYGIWLWQSESNNLKSVLFGSSDLLTTVAISPSDKYVISGSRDGFVTIWDIVKEKKILSISAHNRIVSDISFSPDGKYFASAGGDGVVKIWITTNFEKVELEKDKKFICKQIIKTHQPHITSVDWSIDGKQIGIASYRSTDQSGNSANISIYSTSTGNELMNLGNYGGRDICFSPNGKYFATSHKNGAICLWPTSAFSPTK